jgi:hypothetical protein
VHRAARDPLSSHTLNRACFAQRERDKPREGVVATTITFFPILFAASRASRGFSETAVDELVPR